MTRATVAELTVDERKNLIRESDYRVLYTFAQSRGCVIISFVRHRREAYKLP